MLFFILVGSGLMAEMPLNLDFFITILFCSLITVFFIFISLYIVNLLYIKILNKDIGYLSLISDARHVIKNRWYN